jgi:hypothetical protein
MGKKHTKGPELTEMTHPLAVEAFKALETALVMFGTYAFNDKGPGEVMEVGDLVTRFREAGEAEALAALKDMARDEGFGVSLVSAILLDLQDWDELFDLDQDFTTEHL